MGYATGGLPMPKVILEVPEEVAEKLRAMEARLKATMNHRTAKWPMAKKFCMSMPRTFFDRTIPPKKKASPGVMNNTSAEAINIQAVSPPCMAILRPPEVARQYRNRRHLSQV